MIMALKHIALLYDENQRYAMFPRRQTYLIGVCVYIFKIIYIANDENIFTSLPYKTTIIMHYIRCVYD